MRNKVVALFLFYAFTFSIIGPIDMASISSGSGEHASRNDGASHDLTGHYCETFKGPCKHGESCPNKHLHRPMEASDFKSDSNHSKHISHSDHENNKDTLVIGSACHSSDGSGVTKVIVDRFLVSFKEDFYSFSNYTSLVPSGSSIYVSHIGDTPFRPPVV